MCVAVKPGARSPASLHLPPPPLPPSHNHVSPVSNFLPAGTPGCLGDPCLTLISFLWRLFKDPLSLPGSPLSIHLLNFILSPLSCLLQPEQWGSVILGHPFVFIFLLPKPLPPCGKSLKLEETQTSFLSTGFRVAQLLLPGKD